MFGEAPFGSKPWGGGSTPEYEASLTITPNTADAATLNTTPTLEFTGTDAEGHPLRYQLQIASDSGFASVVIDRTSGTDAGFANTTDGADTDPFDQNEKISFTVQAGDALDSGTYYWRARAFDPVGVGGWSAWTTTRSFTATADSVSVVPDTADAVTLDETPTLQFTGTDTADHALRYQVQIDNNSDLSSPLLDKSSGTDGGFLGPGVADGYAATVDIGEIGFLEGTNDALGQSFKPSSSITLGSVVLRLSGIDDPTGTLQAKIYAHSGIYGSTGIPTGSALATSDAVDATTIPQEPSSGDVVFAFSGANQIALVAGTAYFIVLQYPASGTGSFSMSGNSDETAHPGNSSGYSGGSWSADQASYVFGVFAVGAVAVLDLFPSGGQVSFTVQASEALTNGTYYWRARAIDPSGTNAWSSWTAIRSFVVVTNHACAGTLVGSAATLSGVAAHSSLHVTTGALTGSGAVVAGTSARTAETAPTVVLNTAEMARFASGAAPVLEFTGTDLVGHDLRYEVQIAVDSAFTTTGQTLDDSYSEANWTGSQQFFNSSNRGTGQSFESQGGILDQAKFYLTRAGASTGNVFVRVYTHSGTFGTNSVPVTPLLAVSDPLDVTTITSGSSALYTFTFSGGQRITLAAGTKYFIAVEFTNGSSGNCPSGGYDSSSPSHAGNSASHSLSNWTASAARDVIFYAYVAGSLELDKISGTDAGFVNTVNGGDTDPFTQGQKISFTVQAGDTLGNGVCYWRVRAIDPSGTNTYGPWSATQAFGIGSVPHALTGALVGPDATVAGTASRNVAHDTTGALTAAGSVLDAVAARTREHDATGAPVGSEATLAGAAARTREHDTVGVLVGPGSSLVGTAAYQAKHATSGALTGSGSTLAGNATRFRAFTTTGVLVGTTVLSGAAARFRVHATTGILTGPGSSIAGTAVYNAKHATTGVLAGAGSSVAGTAARTRVHATTGVLTAAGSLLAGVAARTRVHATTGVLVGAGSVLTGSAVHSVTHSTSGVLVGAGSTLTGTAARTREHASTGTLTGAGSSLAATAQRDHFFTTTGVLVGSTTLAGTARRDRTWTTTGVLVGAGAAVDGVAARTRVHATSGILTAAGASIAGDAAHNIAHATSGVLAPGAAVLSGAADRTTPGATHTSTGELVGETVLAGTARRDRAWTTTGVLVGAGTSVAGAAARTRVHATSGALAGPGTVVAGVAARTRVHVTSGALAAAGASLAGTAAHLLSHATNGVLIGSGALLVGAATRAPLHVTAGELVGQGSAVAGVAARVHEHAASGALVGDGAAIVGAAYRTRIHAASGVLAGPGAVAAGAARRDHFFTTAGVLVGSAALAGEARRDHFITTAGELVGAGSIIVGQGQRGQVHHQTAGVLVGPGSIVLGIGSWIGQGSEYRTYTIAPEDRAFLVTDDDRGRLIDAPELIYTVAAEDRTRAIPAENRGLTVLAEQRTLTIAPEDRTRLELLRS